MLPFKLGLVVSMFALMHLVSVNMLLSIVELEPKNVDQIC